MSLRDPHPLGVGKDGKRVPVVLSRSLDHNRSKGVLLGLAVGDALGTTLEFSRPQVAALPTLLGGPHREIVGGGPFGVAAGQVTDDTQMACCVVATLMACGLLDPDDVAARYIRWMRSAFDIGNQTRAALSAIAKGASPLEAGRAVWLNGNRQPAGNGSLMRTAPIGLFSAQLPDNRRVASTLDSAITHYDPRCQIACAAFNSAIACAVNERGDAAAMMAAARDEVIACRDYLIGEIPDERTAIERAAVDLGADLDAAGADDPNLYSRGLHLIEHAGFVRVAFRLAFWHLAHTSSFEGALVDVVNRGGDADTNGAITGALLGARDGADAIPARWSHAVLGALAGQSGPFATEYHPRQLLALLGTDP